MSDLSKFEDQYFIDYERYNCPFCNVRSAHYTVVDNTDYDKEGEKTVHVYIVQCSLCYKKSIHLSELNWNCFDYYGHRRENPFKSVPYGFDSDKYNSDDFKFKLDARFFYHYPTSFFTIDERIPKTIRELVSEAENCKEMNFMVGASGALRKAIYKFLALEKAEGAKYEEKINWLKTKFPRIDPDYFDVLGSIKDMNSQDLHEDDWEPFTSPEFHQLIEATKEILHEVYVEPHLKKNIKDKIFSLKSGRARQISGETDETNQ